MDDKASNRQRDEWIGINFLLKEMESLRSRGVVPDDAFAAIVVEYGARRDGIERGMRFAEAIRKARDLAIISPREALAWSVQARQFGPDRPEGWTEGVRLLRKLGRADDADRLAEEAAARFPQLAGAMADRAETTSPNRPPTAISDRAPTIRFLETDPGPTLRRAEPIPPAAPRISWASVAGEFLEEHWQKLISCLAVLLIVVSSTVGASMVLGPMLWSPAGKAVLAMAYTAMCAGFGVGLVRWGAERAGRMMLLTALIVVPINLILAGESRLLVDPSPFRVALVAVDAAVLFVLARWVVGALGIPSGGAFTAAYFALAAFNAGASRGIPVEAGLAVFLAPSAIFLGAASWLNGRLKPRAGEEPTPAGFAYEEFGLLAFAFLLGVARTGGAVLELAPALYALPAMLAAIACVSTARAIGPVEKDPRRVLAFHQGGLALSALGFALAMARPPGPSALLSGNTLAVAVLGLALFVSLLRSTRRPAYLYCGFAALFVAYFGAFYFAKDLVRSVEEAARAAMGYTRPLPMPFKAINGLVFNAGLVLLSRFFSRRWSDDRLAWHCHAIGLPLSVAACVLSGFEPKAATVCLGGYAILYAIATRMFAEPRLLYLACASAAGSALFGSMLWEGTTLGLRSMIASVLGLAFWAIEATPTLRRAGDPYRKPLIHASRAMAALAMAAATLSAIQAGVIFPSATLAFLLTLTLALLVGHEAPRVSVYLLAIAAMAGSWVGGYHLANGGNPSTSMVYGLVLSTFATALLVVAEWAGRRADRSGAARAFLEAVGWAVPVVVVIAWSLAGLRLVDDRPVPPAILVGALAMLWLTRFRREPVLVYLGLAGLVASAACLCGLVAPQSDLGEGLAWLAITSAACSIGTWGAGEVVRRKGSAFYFEPCFHAAVVLAAGASALAMVSRWDSADSYRLGVAAMLAGTASFGLIAASRRWPASAAAALASAVGASYLALLSQGSTSTDRAWILGLVAALEAIACRGVAWSIRRVSGDPASPMARPIDFGALALTVAAIGPGANSPATMLAVAASSLLLIGCFPSSGWLYATFLAVGDAIYWAGLSGLSREGLIPFVVLGAFVAWGMGVSLQRYGPRIGGRLGLPDLDFEDPPARVAVILGVLAAAIRLDSILEAREGWAGSPWLPWALAVLCLLMLRFEPRRGWVHAAVALTGLGFAATSAPIFETRSWWLSASMSLAVFWSAAGWGAARAEGPFRRRLGIAEGDDSGVFSLWARGMFAIAGAAVASIVVATTFGTAPGSVPVQWADLLLAIGLAALFVALEGWSSGREVLLTAFETLAVLAVWWLGAPGSPLLGRLAIDRTAYLPMATAAASLGVVLLGRLATRRTRGGLADPSGEIGLPGPNRSACWLGFGTALASVYFAAFVGERVALGTLLLATTSLGWMAIGWRRVESAYLGGVTWCLALPLASALAARAAGLTTRVEKGSLVAIGLMTALFGLWWLAGWVRFRASRKDGEPDLDDRVASAMERVAVLATAPAALLAWVDGANAVAAGSGVLFALAVFFAMVARRRGAGWPVYLAQGLLVACYFRAREVLAPSGAADAVVLSTLCYLDLGLAELMARLRLAAYARPTLRSSMALPMVPLLQSAWGGRWDGVDLFVLLSTAAFYGLASLRLRSRTPAYAAAVLVNASLWLAWSMLGWRIADRPQFYLIPVGFSTILFAEVNRRELGHSVVNGARNLGLVLIYASLAAPIWQAQSFGAWLALLLLSLAGILAGIGLRVQSFLWLGLACFVADLTYQLGRLGMEHALARWGVMLTLGIALILFVALNEKKRIVATMCQYYDVARGWD